jgi:hypothetical protein
MRKTRAAQENGTGKSPIPIAFAFLISSILALLSACSTTVQPKYQATGKLKPLPGADKIGVTVEIRDQRSINPKLIFSRSGQVLYKTADDQALATAFRSGILNGLTQQGFSNSPSPSKILKLAITKFEIHDEKDAPIYPPDWRGHFEAAASVEEVGGGKAHEVLVADNWTLHTGQDPYEDTSLDRTEATKISSDLISFAIDETLANRTVQSELLNKR